MHLFSSSSRLKKMWEILLCLLSARNTVLVDKTIKHFGMRFALTIESFFCRFQNTVTFRLEINRRRDICFRFAEIGKHLWIWPQSCLWCQKFHARNHFSKLLGIIISIKDGCQLGWPLGSSRILIHQLALTSADTYLLCMGDANERLGLSPHF